MNIQPAPSRELRQILESAKEAAERRDFQRHIELLESASRLAPTDVIIFFGLGGAYGKRYEYAAARRCLERAVEVADRKSEALTRAGEVCLKFRRVAMAGDFFKRATEEKNIFPIARIGLADIYEQQGRYDEARALIEEALRLDAGLPVAWLALARLERRAGELTKASTTLRNFFQMPECKMWWRVKALCDLGGILDSQGEYDQAMSCFVEAKGMLRPPERVFAPHRRLQASGLDLISNIGAEDVRRWLDSMEELGPLGRLSVVGGHLYHSAASLLDRDLASHPGIDFVDDSRVFLDEVFNPARRAHLECDSHSAFLKKASPDVLRQMRELYFRRNELFLDRKIESGLLVEKNHILNMFLPAMIRLFPEAKFLMMIRDPRDACLASFMQFTPLNACSTPFLSLQGTVGEYVAAMNMWRRFMSYLGNPQMEVRHEEVAADFASARARAMAFIGAEEIGSGAQPLQKNTGTLLQYNPSRDIFEKPGHWRNYEKHLEPHLEQLEALVTAFGYR